MRILEKIATAKSVLVALSNNPSMDETAAAFGLTLMLDKVGKHATAIYSGATPDVEPQNFQSAGTGLAMNDQLYPPDPSAFRIPGM